MTRFAKIMILAALVLLLAVTGTGCLDSKDINDKIIATTIAVDYRDGEVWFYVEYANLEAGRGSESMSGTGGSKYKLRKSHGKTLADARDNINRQLDQEIYLSGVRTLVMTEEFARRDVVEYLYRLRADETYRKKVITVVTREDLDTLFETINGQDESVGYCIEETVKTLDAGGESFTRTTARLLENLSSPYTGTLFSCMGLQDEESALVGYSVVNDTRVTGFIPVEDSRGVVIMKADKVKFVYIVPYRDNDFTIETELTKKSIRPSYAGGQISYALSFSFNATLLYGKKKTPYGFTQQVNEDVADILSGMIRDDIVTAIEQAQTVYQTDYLQFDDIFRIRYPVLFEQMNWQDEFAKAAYTVDVSVDLGTTMMDYSPNDVQ